MNPIKTEAQIVDISSLL